MGNEYQGINIFNALKDIEVIKDKLRVQYPNFKFVAEKGDIGEISITLYRRQNCRVSGMNIGNLNFFH